MERLLKIMLTLVATAFLAACGGGGYDSAVMPNTDFEEEGENNHGKIELTSASNAQMQATMIRARARTPDGRIADSTTVETGISTESRNQTAFVAGIGGTLLPTAGSLAKGSPGDTVIQGGSAVALSESASGASAGSSAGSSCPPSLPNC